MKILTANCAGLKRKMFTLKQEMKSQACAIAMLQETHYKNKGQIRIPNHIVFEATRKKEKGGTAIIAHTNLKPVLISQYEDEIEMLVVEVKVANKVMRLITGYGPQENMNENERLPFFIALENEISKAELAGTPVIIGMDANSKLGKNLISQDKHDQSPNGSLLEGILKRHGLIVVNGLKICKGTITRRRCTKKSIEESTIDFVIISAEIEGMVKSMLIDEDKKHSMANINKAGAKTVESDHNTIITEFTLKWSTKIKVPRIEIMNLMNKKGQEKFRKATEEGNELSKIFDDSSKSVNDLVFKFVKKLNEIVRKSFQKVRIKEKSNTETDKLYKKWREIKHNTDVKSMKELTEIEELLADKANENYNMVEKLVSALDGEEGGFRAEKLWKLKKKLFPKSKDPPMAMVDKDGNLQTEAEKVNEIGLETIIKRLENRQIKEGMEYVKTFREELCDERLKTASENKTLPWTMSDLEAVLEYLKKEKARDPEDLVNEIFKPEVAGSDLKKAILKMMNRVKEEQIFPASWQNCNVSTMWKGKNAKNDFKNHRGVFRLSIFRCILDRLMYNDEYEIIDTNLTDCNVGARRNRNIRDNIFVINAIMNSVVNGNEKPVDLELYDIETCYDALWLKETINSLYEAGIRNDKLCLLYKENQNANIVVKTSQGMSRRESISEIVMQGSVFGGLQCVTQMDELVKVSYENPEMLYMYKGVVPTPPIEMVDDIITATTCKENIGFKNSMVNSFMDHKKLKISHKKSCIIHIGKQSGNCCDLEVGDEKMKQETHSKYLGDIIDTSGRIKATIQARIAKGYGIISEILAITDEIPFLHKRIKVGLQLRQAKFLNGILFNSECWHGVTVMDVVRLERLDNILLRGILKSHSKTPIESLHQELGTINIKYILASRRILYLHNILTKDKKEIVPKYYFAQKEKPSRGDFCQMVARDMKEIKLYLSEDEITKSNKKFFKKLVKQKCRQTAIDNFKKLQLSHKKVRDIQYVTHEPQTYLTSSMFNDRERGVLLSLRTHMTRNMKANFTKQFKTHSCQLKCDITSLDSQEHLMVCTELSPHIEKHMRDIQYNDMYSQDIHKQLGVAKLFVQLLDLRDKRLEELESSPAGAGPAALSV